LHGSIYFGMDGRQIDWKICDVCSNMNDPAVKVALASSILLSGILAAVAFRPDPAASNPAGHSLSELMALRNRRLPEKQVSAPKVNEVKDNAACSAPVQTSAADSSPRIPKVLAPLDNPPPIPAFSSKYPGDGPVSAGGWGMPLDPPQEEKQPDKGPHVHKIVDGDTLAALAERYLGSPSRAMEIFEINRNVLNDPELLPIGAELKIPEK
jgi:hypothetical protein